MDVELVARSSLSSLQRTPAENFIVSPSNWEDWSWSGLRKQFKCKNLEKLYLIYRRRLENGYMLLFVLLQMVLGIVHCFVLLSTTRLQDAIIDLIIAGVENALLFPIIALSFRSEWIAEKVYLPVYFSCMIIAILVASDVSLVILNTINYSNELYAFRPAFASHTILVCYVFLPLSNHLQTFVLGITASFCYLASLVLITYRNEPACGAKLVTDVWYHLCINCLGLYFRFMNEVVIRRSFLDRRKCVESTLKLNYEKDQEEQLTRSILPPHFAAKIKENFRTIFKFIEKQKSPIRARSSTSIPKDFYVEIHENVSILYADVVNFSGLTLTLPVKKLVETLNDLFGSFDEASERHNVLRIKFLGDCYYCVSGVPVPNPQHATSCVDLGLDMISIINSIRAKVERECGVDVNMRIGVHSGKIISGILGINKWQYDVWSRDVIIANKMEQTGEAGKVHVTQQTLDLLDTKMYNCKLVTDVNDDVLRKYGIFHSYLITPMPTFTPISRNANVRLVFVTSENHHTPFSTSKQFNIRYTEPDMQSYSFRRKTHFMNALHRNYHLMLKAADAEMEKAIEQMPLSKWEQWCHWEIINPISLTFSNWRWELPYLREPDPLFKFYLACSALVLFLAGFSFLIPALLSNDLWPYISVSMTLTYSISLVLVVAFIPIAWTQFLWNRYNGVDDEGKNNTHPQPRNKMLKFFYRTSVEIVWNQIFRVALYIAIIVSMAYAMVFSVLIDCEDDRMNHAINDTEILVTPCVSTPWLLTENCALVVVTTFLFLRMHFVLKLLVAICITLVYAWFVCDYRSYIFEFGLETWSPLIGKNLAHILTIVYLTLSLHLIDRQSEYLSRLDYHWKRQLMKEQDEAFNTRNANKLLLRNILPEHVAEFYLNMERLDDNSLYHEAHDYVAVMFATLTDLSIDESNILVDFNEIICNFDKLLYEPNYVCRIEKIKLAGTTYMAACGLETSRRNSSHNININEFESKYDVVEIMTKFAADMMAVLKNMDAFLIKSYKLRIGVSHGEVTAGVVGSQKPLYDIWGDAVNMASRMDTTGEPGKIQVTEETAEILNMKGVKCNLRGGTWVKPKGLVTTYFVGLNEKMELERIQPKEETNL
ncbi:hypothetical protein QAD02_009752 [Eretmocerus hayati]|uniref:Uncharacterized protein n=1 Tax=Eretmocerus hayati TaxID=131215 RepID=A0ACC2NCM9_9HYME|nr:hypothetical protein QAD02_009752 [Eretmocerus hayati]